MPLGAGLTDGRGADEGLGPRGAPARSAHPEAPVPADLDPQDVREVVNFLDFLLLYPYDLPKQIENYRRRKDPATP